MNFHMVIIASGIARGRIRTTGTTTTIGSCRMASLSQLIGDIDLQPCLIASFFILDIPVIVNLHLSKQGIRLPESV